MEHGRSAADFDDLSRQVRQLTALIAEQQATIAQQQATIAAQHEALARASEQLTLLKKALFSPRRERYVPSPDQKLLFASELPDAPPTEISPASSASRPTSKSKHRRKFVIPEFLPQQRIEHALPHNERPCGCCGEERVIISEHVTRQIELTPAQAHVEVHVRYTYACKHCRSGEQVVTTSKPPAPIEKSPFGASLLAWIISSKFERHRVQGEAVSKMRVGLSRPGDRIWSQTSPNCGGQEPSWEASGAKGAARPRQVRFAKSNASEPLMKCRNRTDDVKTGGGVDSGISMGGACFLDHAASGIKAARARIRLGNGTLEPVVSMLREKLKRRTRESLSTNARHRGGTTRSSVERWEIRLEQRGRVIQSLDNRSTASAGGAHA